MPPHSPASASPAATPPPSPSLLEPNSFLRSRFSISFCAASCSFSFSSLSFSPEDAPECAAPPGSGEAVPAVSVEGCEGDTMLVSVRVIN